MRVHMWGKMLLRTCRGVLKELRAVSGGGEAGEQWRFLVSVVRSRGTERHEPQEKEKGLSTLESYLSYLQSSRRHKELLERYQGRGERSIEESAHLVGLALPENGTETQQSAS